MEMFWWQQISRSRSRHSHWSICLLALLRRFYSPINLKKYFSPLLTLYFQRKSWRWRVYFLWSQRVQWKLILPWNQNKRPIAWRCNALVVSCFWVLKINVFLLEIWLSFSTLEDVQIRWKWNIYYSFFPFNNLSIDLIQTSQWKSWWWLHKCD